CPAGSEPLGPPAILLANGADIPPVLNFPKRSTTAASPSANFKLRTESASFSASTGSSCICPRQRLTFISSSLASSPAGQGTEETVNSSGFVGVSSCGIVMVANRICPPPARWDQPSGSFQLGLPPASLGNVID